ncbi:hypothetical protein B0H13DRAFT_1635308, partial [Mycena leptocephala]
CAQVDLITWRVEQSVEGPGIRLFQDVNFRNVSITALNAQKDKINEIGCRKFAEETKQELVHFYSQDTLVDNAGSRGRRAKTEKNREVVNTTKNLPMHRQRQLWDAFPSSSDHIPGKLSLCLGLPALIRNTDATELCIAKGQEATVVGWREAVGNHDQRILDTLFVELVKLPRTVSILGLPPNVIALARGRKNIWCSLPDDMTVQVSREQVLILPNFVMTDYSSQGKTRDFNVVDLHNCKNHYSYYTALSRSSTSAGTIILQGLSPSKITRGISGHLRPEFKELEMLNEIIAKHLNLLRFTILLHIIIRVVVIFEIYLCYPKT